jgi:hypothetical protein
MKSLPADTHNDRYLKVRSWLGVAWRVIDLLERPLEGEPVADGAPERSVEFRSSRAHRRLHVRISRSGPIGIDVDAAHDIAPLWLEHGIREACAVSEVIGVTLQIS